MNWSSFAFAHTLKARLHRGAVETLGSPYYRVTGKLDAPAVRAPIEIHVCWDFEQVVRWPPRVFCRESWMREDVEWHNDRETGMCWVLENEWRDILGPQGRWPGDIVRIGNMWLLNNVKSLISRHHYAHLAGLKHWLKEWDAWPHYDKGVQQYERERQRTPEPK
jgi:hypothetical protein